MYRRGGPGLLGLIYFFVGAFVAGGEGFLETARTITEIVSGVLAVVLWPLVLLGVSFHLG